VEGREIKWSEVKGNKVKWRKMKRKEENSLEGLWEMLEKKKISKFRKCPQERILPSKKKI
jgi:hypothetical protein